MTSSMELLLEARALDCSDRRAEALSAYRAYLEAQPGDAQTWAEYGGLLMVMGHPEMAQEACRRALQIDAEHRAALLNSGYLAMRQNRLEEAEGCLRHILAKAPRDIEARLALGACLLKKDDLMGARRALEKVLQEVPDHSQARHILGSILVRQGDWFALRREAEWDFAARPDEFSVEFERGALSLLFGEMPSGWQQYETRFQGPDPVAPRRSFSQPRWEGGPFPGRTLLLHWEQGFGDSLMFVRYAPRVKALGGRVVLLAQPPLAELLSTCPGLDEVISEGDVLPSFDLQLPLLSLPWIFRTDLDSIPCEIPYLGLPARIPNRTGIARVLAASEGRTRIALAWSGSPRHKRDAERSLPPPALAPLARLQGIAWHGFQIGAREMPPLGVVDLAPLLSNFSDTAYALSGMDLVITVDTSLAHLAGALGIPTLLLLPFQPDFRWMLYREDSPWYPSMRIYRQPSPGDWESVIRQVLGDLGGQAGL